MPNKKQQKNAFYFFMKSEEPNLRREGRVFPNGMRDIVPICHPRWKILPPKDKERFERMAKEFKNKMRGKEGDMYRLDNQGERVAYRTNKYTELEKRRMQEKKLMRKNWPPGAEVVNEKFYFISFQILCQTEDGHYLPCEIALIEYSILNGITKHLHRFIEPGKIPTGYRFACIEHSQDTHQIPVENFQMADNNYFGLWNQIENFINPNGEKDEYPPLFCLGAGENYKLVEYCLDWVHAHACTGIPNRIKHVFEVESLLHELITHIGKVATLPSCVSWLTSADWDYEPNTKCDYHEELEVKDCSLGIVKRFGFCFSNCLCESYGVELTEKHVIMRKDIPKMTVVAPSSVPLSRQRMPPSQSYNNIPPRMQKKKVQEEEEEYSDLRLPKHPDHYGSGEPAVSNTWGRSMGGVSSGGGAMGGFSDTNYPPIGRGAALQYANNFPPAMEDPGARFDSHQAPMMMGRGINQAMQGMSVSTKHAGRAGPPPASAAPPPPMSWKQQPVGIGRGMMTLNQSNGGDPPGYYQAPPMGYPSNERPAHSGNGDDYIPLRLPSQAPQEKPTDLPAFPPDNGPKIQIGRGSGSGYGGIMEKLLRNGVMPGISMGRGYAPPDWVDDGTLGPVRR